MKKIFRNLKNKVRNFLLTNQFLRRIKVFIHRTFFPMLLRFFLVSLTLIVLVAVMLKIFNPTYLNKIYRKTSFYFFHYLHLDNREFSQINILGNKRVKKAEIITIITRVKEQATDNVYDDYRPLIQSFIDRIKTELPWIDQVIITRNMPDTLNIIVTEYQPFAIWQNDKNKYVTDKMGNLIPIDEDDEEFSHMVILSGRGANIHAQSLFNIFAIDPDFSANIYSATWIGNRRWDIRLENGLLIKLPESNISDAWQKLIKIYNLPGSIFGLQVIDLRVNDKIYLEYEDSVIKEIKSL